LESKWSADHVVPHAAGGDHAVGNYLPACSVCNRLRWFYTPEQIREILQMGICARADIRNQTSLGTALKHRLTSRQALNQKRRAKHDKT